MDQSIVDDWYELFLYREGNQTIDNGDGKKTQITTTNALGYISQIYIYNTVYFYYLKAIGMYECVTYTRMVDAMMVCYVSQMDQPNMDAILELNFSVSLWAPMERHEKLHAAIPRYKNKLRCVINHQSDFSIFMFVYNTEEAEHTINEQCHETTTCATSNYKSKATQTCNLEIFSIFNRPLNLCKAVINRELTGSINQTSVYLSLPQCAIEKDQQTHKRPTPQDNMKAISRMYHKIDLNQLNRYDKYYRCTVCFSFFMSIDEYNLNKCVFCIFGKRFEAQ
ncbi:hypothetical protein [Mocis latipes granulovirus]|uniref:Uncharacterized protein n=1 Tax=Mocis latipes granulovirus TaxID=2072024 RepID=A0A161CD60_9BBAC|nr:hypothetical protein [Mocis latipes granulovirus]AKR17481.1 hypothetical protein [Mocis latipes granulovirus]